MAAYRFDFFDSVFALSGTLIVFDISAYTKYILPERSFDEEYFEHHN